MNHAGISIKYDWGKTQKSQALHWATLSSDCEHEILEITSGYRVLLTYNLCYQQQLPPSPSQGELGVDFLQGLNFKPAPVDITSLKAYSILQEHLKDPGWMTDGKLRPRPQDTSQQPTRQKAPREEARQLPK